jgi:hypothetical protein
MKSTISGTFKDRGLKRNQLAFLLGLFVLLLNPTSFSLAQQGGISIGDIVEVTSGQGLRLRTEPGLDTSIIATLPYKTQMKVVGGPRTNIAGFNWWELEGMQMRGWAAENYLRVVSGTEMGPSASTAPGCEQPYPAIQYCPQRDRSIYTILIDLNNPHVRLETVMANDKENVNTANREFVNNMGERRKTDGAVVVINADYFGDSNPVHGPEGYTVLKGQRLDGPDHGDFDNGVATLRSSLVFSRSKLDGGNAPIKVSILRLDDDHYVPDPEETYYAVGGGPQIVLNGVWDWARGRTQPNYKNYPECPRDYFDSDVINGECFRNTGDWDADNKMWTVVGKTTDGQLLMLLALYPDVQSALQMYQVQEAIKLDGGGSSQLWYNNTSVVSGGRDIANALMVFYKNDYEFVERPPQFPVVVSGESLEIKMTLKNKGADIWTQKDYGISVINSPWDMNLQARLPHDVKPGETVTVTWQSPPIDQAWDFYSFDLQLVDHGNEFPMEPISVRAIVIPQSLAEKKEELEKEIREWVEKGVDDIEQAITEWIKRQLMSAWERLIYDLTHCNLSLAVIIVAGLFVYRRAHL